MQDVNCDADEDGTGIGMVDDARGGIGAGSLRPSVRLVQPPTDAIPAGLLSVRGGGRNGDCGGGDT
eukprot:31624-Eustigmatos_ZCMA.PRE.1